MYKNNHSLVYICFAILLFSCNAKPSLDPRPEKITQNFADSYKAPTFIADNRLEIVNGMAPALQQLMIEHAKERKIPGIAYGIVVDNKLVISSAKV